MCVIYRLFLHMTVIETNYQQRNVFYYIKPFNASINVLFLLENTQNLPQLYLGFYLTCFSVLRDYTVFSRQTKEGKGIWNCLKSDKFVIFFQFLGS